MICYSIVLLSSLTTFILIFILFFFNDPATTEIYTLSLHDALPISGLWLRDGASLNLAPLDIALEGSGLVFSRSEEHTSELQSHHDLVCRLLLEKKKKKKKKTKKL